MKDERQIEELLEKTEAPALRAGLRDQVLCAVGVRLEETQKKTVPHWASWALAASLMAGVGLQWAAGLREAGHRQRVMASWCRVKEGDAAQILEEYEMPLRLARRARHSSVEDLERRMAVYRMTKGEINGS